MTTPELLSDDMFSSIIVANYDMLKLLCPLAVEMNRLVAQTVATYPDSAEPLDIIELGSGTGITTLALLTVKDNAHIVSIDNQASMQEVAKRNLQAWMADNRLSFCTDDALSALKNIPDNSVDIVASAYTLHNFLNDYREQVIKEIFRVLKPKGQFINGDRYALDDIDEHTHLTQQDASHFFKVLIAANKLDLLEQWILHIFSDDSENHIMRESVALTQMQQAGFIDIQLSHRMNVNALVTATKPTKEKQDV